MSEKKQGRFNIKFLAIGAAVILILAGAVWVALPLLKTGGKESAPFRIDEIDPSGADQTETDQTDTARPPLTKQPNIQNPAPATPLFPEQDDSSAKPKPLPVRPADQPQGFAFMNAVIEPLQTQLDRFWGWRPNDIIEFTDNVNNYQLGVLEATRRTSIVLAERISRTGSSDPYVRELEQAMSMFAIDPDSYMFPAPESKYQEGLDNFQKYKEMLRNKTARFYNRMDNLVPLLLTYESILGSCTENLLKQDISFFKVDDIFFYSQGAAAMVLSVMEGVGVDFRETIQGANGVEVYDEIVRSLRQIAEMKPLIVLKGGPNSIFANHRANMAGPMSRARFHMNILHGALTGNL
jgi:hypothetical protein